ncbi:MAG: hypothetical protein Q9170_007196 [Blastenia crenularia]
MSLVFWRYQTATDSLRIVTVHLIPRKNENDIARFINLLAPSDDPIIIGRASKNPSKNLLPQPGNAWFDSPIMSRQHGKLFLASKEEVHIQDSASTHGTWLGRRRLAANQSYRLANGDMITFGTTITSGPVTYLARSFDVRLLWAELVSPSSLSISEAEHSTFSVPNDDVESVSDDSDPGACQILDSHPRTFSVPSSDDEIEVDDEDDAVIPTSRRLFLASVNAKASESSPVELSLSHNSNAHEQSDDQNQKERSMSQTGSRTVPTATDDDPLTVDDIIDDNSGDEGPDVIHSGQGRNTATGRGDFVGDTAAASMSIEEIPDTHPSLSHLEPQSYNAGNDGHDRQGKESLSGNQEPDSCLGQSDDVDSESSEHCPTQSNARTRVFFHTPSIASTNASSNDLFGPSKSKSPCEDEEGCSNRSVDEQEKDSSRQHDNYDYESEFSYSQASSPSSDGSLASVEVRSSRSIVLPDNVERSSGPESNQSSYRNQSTADSKRNDTGEIPMTPLSSSHLPPEITSFGYPYTAANTHSPYPNVPRANRHLSDSLSFWSKTVEPYQQGTASITRDLHPTTVRPPSPSDAALVRKATLGRVENPQSYLGNADTSTPLGSYDCSGYDSQPAFTRSGYGLPPAKFFGDLRSDPAMSKHRSTLASLLAQASDDWQVGQVDGPNLQKSRSPDYQQGPFSRSFQSSQSATGPSNESSQSSIRFVQEDYLNELRRDRIIRENQNQDQIKSNKVDISNLVNAQTESIRGKKRKSDQMSTEEPSSGTSSNDSHPLSLPAAVQGTNIAIERTCEITSADHEKISQEMARHLSQPDNKITEEGPARKKSRTSNSKASTIGKFVSGICLGVAGAFAAFVAATPADVWDEALREAVRIK